MLNLLQFTSFSWGKFGLKDLICVKNLTFRNSALLVYLPSERPGLFWKMLEGGGYYEKCAVLEYWWKIYDILVVKNCIKYVRLWRHYHTF